jgi:hypothetical protein
MDTFTRYPNASSFASAAAFNTWRLRHRPTNSTTLGEAKLDTIVHALIRHGGSSWLTASSLAAVGIPLKDFKIMARRPNKDGDTAFHVAMCLEDPVARQQAVDFLFMLDPDLPQTPHGHASFTQSTVLRFLDVYADRHTSRQERPDLRKLLLTMYEHGGHTPCGTHPFQYVTCQETLGGILPPLTHPLFNSPPLTLSLMREPVHRTMRGSTEPWRGKSLDVFSLGDALTSNLDIAKKIRGWLLEEGTLERLTWWAAQTNVDLSTPVVKGNAKVPLSEHLAKLSTIRSQMLYRHETQQLATELFLKEHAHDTLVSFNKAFYRTALSPQPLLPIETFSRELPFSLDAMTLSSDDLFEDTGNTPLSHVLVQRKLLTADAPNPLEWLTFLATNADGVSWQASFQGTLSSEIQEALGLSYPDTLSLSVIDAVRMGVSLHERHASPSVVQAMYGAIQQIERALLIERTAPQLTKPAVSHAL